MVENLQSDNQLVKDIGRNIKKLREKTGLTAQEFSQKVNITRVQSLYEYEKGLRSPKANVLYNIATVFGVSIDSIFETEDRVLMVSTKEERSKIIYEWEREIRDSSSGMVGLRKIVLPFFSRIHHTKLSNIVLEEQRGHPSSREHISDWKKRVELFESGGYVSKEICYMPSIIGYSKGEGKCNEIPCEERISQLELIIERIGKYKDSLEIRIVEQPPKISFAIYGKRLILNGETCFFVSRNPGLVKAFNQEFTALWDTCKLKTREQVSEFLDTLVKDLTARLEDQRQVRS
ncbi:MAG: helix-turn-helix domain-containing protein [Candidatus Brocadiales bacterium]